MLRPPMPETARRVAYRILIGAAIVDVVIGLAFLLFGQRLFPPAQAWAAWVVGGVFVAFGLVPLLIARARFAPTPPASGPSGAGPTAAGPTAAGPASADAGSAAAARPKAEPVVRRR